MIDYDAILIGAGPAGLSAGIYLARAGWRTLLMEKDLPGGQARRIARIENFPGFPSGISGRSLMNRFTTHALHWGARFSRAAVVKISRRGGLFAVQTPSERLRCGALLLCSGSAFKPLGVAGAESVDGIFHAAFEEASRYGGRDVAVVGGGEAAAHQALALARHGARVTLICRGRRLKAHRRLLEEVRGCGRIRPLFGFVVAEIHGHRHLRSVTARDAATGRTCGLRTDALFVLVGQSPEKGLVPWRRTPPGFFLAGDVCQSRFRQVAVAAGDGVRAAMECERYLRERFSGYADDAASRADRDLAPAAGAIPRTRPGWSGRGQGVRPLPRSPADRAAGGSAVDPAAA